MSVMDMNSRMAMAEKLSVQQLQQAVQSGSLPAYIGIPLIEQKNKEKAQMAAAQQGQQKPPSVASQILQQAEQGVAQLPSNLPEQGMADGGIVAFAEGGDTDDFDVEAYREQEDEDEYASSLRALIEVAQAAAEEGVSTRKKKDKKYADGGIASFNGEYDSLVSGEASSAEFDPRYEDTEPFDVGAALDQARAERKTAAGNLRGLNPRTDRFKFDASKDQLNQLTNRERQLQNMYSDSMSNSPNARPATYADLLRARPNMNGGRNIPPLPNVPYAPPSAALLPTVTVTPDSASPEPMPTNTEDMDITRDTGIPGGALPNKGIANLPAASTANPAVPGAPQGKVTPTALVNQVAEQTGKPRSAYDDFLDEIKAGREDLKTQAEKDKYMAFISAGLGMMSGTSPNALANIGQGAQAGVASYMASGKQRAAEKAALNKNLLMGRRYKSMEDIAARTADINEARYAAIAAARGAGGESKADAENRRKLLDVGNLAQRYEKGLVDQLKLRINPDIYPDKFAAEYRKIQEDPKLKKYNAAINQLTEKMYGLSDEKPDQSAPSNRLRVDKNGNIIQ